jgi:hypothetical protein
VGSGFIYFIIVGMWIAYFLPRWISTHEEVSGRTVEKFEKTMKVVGVTSGNAVPDYEALIKKRDHQIANRRLTFTAILGLTSIVILFAAIGLVTTSVISLPVSAFILYIVHARHQINAMQDELNRAQALQQSALRPTGNKYSELIARAKRVNTQLNISEEQWTPLSERIVDYSRDVQSIVILPKGSAEKNRDTWEPTAVPTPSYVTAPKAAAQRKTIDLTIPGAWSEAQERAMREAMAPKSDQIFDQEQADAMEEHLRQYRASGQ